MKTNLRIRGRKFHDIQLPVGPGPPFIFRVSLTVVELGGGSSVLIIQLEPPVRAKSLKPAQLKALREAGWYQAEAKSDLDNGILDKAQYGGVLRCLALTQIGLAYAQKASAFTKTILSGNTLRDAECDIADMANSEERHAEVSKALAGHEKVSNTDLHNYAGAYLAPEYFNKPEYFKSYRQFERMVVEKWYELSRKHRSLKERLDAMRRHLETQRKDADENTQRNLYMLAVAVLCAGNEVHECLMPRVLEVLAEKKLIDADSCQFNLEIHQQQERLGGIVLALHPLLHLLLETEDGCKLVVAWAKDPANKNLSDQLNRLLATTIRIYGSLVDYEKDRSRPGSRKRLSATKPADFADHDGYQEGTALNNIKDRDDPAANADQNLLLESLRARFARDRDVEVFLECEFKHSTQSTIAKKYRKTQSWVSKAIERGRRKVLSWMKSEGLDKFL